MAIPFLSAIAGPEGFTGAPSNHYQLRCDLEIRVTDSGYVFITSHYADKATDKGITNDFTKVEYRWWDYHAGNPWSAADQPLFEALHTRTLALMDSFKAEDFRSVRPADRPVSGGARAIRKRRASRRILRQGQKMARQPGTRQQFSRRLYHQDRQHQRGLFVKIPIDHTVGLRALCMETSSRIGL